MDDHSKDYFRNGKKIIEFSIDGDDRVFQIADRHSYTFGKTKLTIPTPNITGIFLNAAEKETAQARSIYKSDIQPILNLKEDIELSDLTKCAIFCLYRAYSDCRYYIVHRYREPGKYTYTARLPLP
jgi:hypothetical protein